MKTDYDTFAGAYARANESNLLNAYYARPAMLALAGDVQSRRILDAGCGAGPLSEGLREKGATVTGIDSSPAMIELAQRKLGADADLHVADLSEPLPFDDDLFDGVVASLVLHYLQDWHAPLTELRRVLRPGGRLTLSVPHPSAYLVNYPTRDYFAVTQYSETFTFGDEEATLTYWHRPLHAMTDAFTEAGFRISVVSEPPYATNVPRELLPPDLGDRSAFVCFLFFVLEA
ncbi:class I SAM-dependent methyltransferase [Luteipulveratus mongoliensis]|nr:class I SAM-dependent methyltransferase [Luteipulveratus mongoliensis]